MKTIITTIILFIILNFNLYSINNDYLSNDFKKIISIDENNKIFIETDFNKIDYKQYLYFFSLVSEETNNYENYFNWFKNEEIEINKQLLNYFKTVDIKLLKTDKQKEFAEKLLFLIHDSIFNNYSFNADRLSDIINGYYNCVSSSIMYSIFLQKYNFIHNAVQTSDHVFVKIIFNEDEVIDVETTNRFGFDPGKKKEVLDAFGKTTGFTYVPQNNYSARKDINLKYLILDVYHNLLNYYFAKNEYLKSCKIAYVIYLIKNDISGKDDFDASFNNLIAYYAAQKNYINAIENINSYLLFIGIENKFIITRFDLINNLINDWIDINQNDSINLFLLNENNRFENLKNDSRFIKSYLFFIYKMTKLSKGLEYKNAFVLLNDFLKLNPINNEIIDFRYNLLNNYVYEWNDFNRFEETNNYLLSQNDLFDFLKDDKYFIDIYTSFIYKQIDYFNKNNQFNDSYNLIKYFNKLFKSDDIIKIFSNIIIDEFNYYKNNNNTSIYKSRFGQLLDDFPDYKNIINKFKIIYLTDNILFLTKSNDYKTAINEYKMLYFENRDDNNIKNNLINLYIDYSIKLYNNNDIDNLIKYCDEAVNLFPDNTTINNNYLSFLINFINNEINNNNYKNAKNILNIAKTKFKDNKKLFNIEQSLK